MHLSPAERLRTKLSQYSPWVQGQLGVPPESWAIVEMKLSLGDLGLHSLLGEHLFRQQGAVWPSLADGLARLSLAPGFTHLELNTVDQSDIRSCAWSGRFREAAFAFELRDLPFPMVVVLDEYPIPTYGGSQIMGFQWLIAAKQHLPTAASFLHRLSTQGRKRVQVVGGNDYTLAVPHPHSAYGWDDVMLDEANQHLVRQDFEHFLARREWFAARRVPWRRGYLFHGPPGNGKTSAVRAMASHPQISVFSLNFAGEDIYDNEISMLFSQAASFAPSLIVLEDLDRVFHFEGEEKKVNVTLSHLLNCLDGLFSAEGVIVVATANHPERLDKAILRRPGRFDRVVHFPLPDAGLREKYLRKLCPEAEDLQFLVRATDRYSFAQLRELWLAAAQLVWTRGGDDAESPILTADLELALKDLHREQFSGSGAHFGF
ncbi:MAG: AAA family ATPase [Bryobacter sp.]|nr:AAA family ATPase [Bryobacter sp.]